MLLYCLYCGFYFFIHDRIKRGRGEARGRDSKKALGRGVEEGGREGKEGDGVGDREGRAAGTKSVIRISKNEAVMA